MKRTLKSNAGGGTRTRKRYASKQVANLPRLPVSPHRHCIYIFPISSELFHPLTVSVSASLLYTPKKKAPVVENYLTDKMKCYVYMYLDLDKVPFYIGKGVRDRWRPSAHIHTTNKYLTRKILKIGVKNVRVHFLHKNLSNADALYWEAFWISCIGRHNCNEGTLCNISADGAGADSFLGRKHTEETKQKMSIASCGELNPNFGKPATNRGIPHTEKTKQKISKARQKYCKNHSNSFKGKKHTEETRRKMSEAHKGKVPWNKGKPRSKETRRKISETLRRKNLLCLS